MHYLVCSDIFNAQIFICETYGGTEKNTYLLTYPELECRLEYVSLLIRIGGMCHF